MLLQYRVCVLNDEEERKQRKEFPDYDSLKGTVSLTPEQAAANSCYEIIHQTKNQDQDQEKQLDQPAESPQKPLPTIEELVKTETGKTKKRRNYSEGIPEEFL